MALFGRVDDNLPLLTRFYQLDPTLPDTDDDEEELVKTELHQFADSAHKRTDVYPDSRRVISIFHLRRYQELHGIVRRLMDGLADGGSIDVPDLRRLERLFDEYEQVPVMEGPARFVSTVDPELKRNSFAYNGEDEGKTVEVNSLSVVLLPSLYKSQLVLRSILVELRELFTGDNKKRVCRCAECHNSFVMTRSKQKFCSHRCRTRLSSRKAYQNKSL